MAQRGDWWCYEHAQEISEKLVMGPLAQRVGEPWTAMVAWGRSVLRTRLEYEAQARQRQDDAARVADLMRQAEADKNAAAQEAADTYEWQIKLLEYKEEELLKRYAPSQLPTAQPSR